MVITVIGIRKINFIDETSKKEIAGTKIFYSREPFSHEIDVIGCFADSVFISSRIVLPKISIGDTCELFYDFNGKKAILSSVMNLT